MTRFVMALALALLLLAGGSAHADDAIGLSFEPDHFVRDILVDVGVPFNGYLYLNHPTSMYIAGYETSISFRVPGVQVLTAEGPNGWTNFGDPANHLVGYQVPLPVPGEALVLGTVTLMLSVERWNVIVDTGPSDPSSLDPPQACYADGIDLDLLVPCQTTYSYINRSVAVEPVSLSSIKALFD